MRSFNGVLGRRSGLTGYHAGSLPPKSSKARAGTLSFPLTNSFPYTEFFMDKRSRYFELLAVEVAKGSRLRDAAGLAKCAESTAYRLGRDPIFRRRVSELRSAATDAAIGSLTELATDAVAALGAVLRDQEAKPADRINAAKTALAMLAPLSELHELRSRLDAIEAQQTLRIA